MSEIIVLYDGFSYMNGDNKMIANCTCTLIKGRHNIIVDTMTAWDADKILSGLHNHNIQPEDIHFVISTHGHSDHIGNNNLFLKAKHIVGFSISYKETYFLHPFEKGDLFEKFEDIQDSKIWIEAGSEDPIQQSKNRLKIVELVDWIIPGHGNKFRVTEDLRKILRKMDTCEKDTQ